MNNNQVYTISYIEFDSEQNVYQIQQQIKQESQVTPSQLTISISMKRFDWLRKFDRNPAYISLNYNGRKQHQSRTGGCLSLAFFILVAFIFMFKIIYMFQKSNVVFQTRIGKDSFDDVDLTDADIRISFKDKNNNYIQPAALAQAGLQVVFLWKQLFRDKVIKNDSQLVHCQFIGQLNQTFKQNISIETNPKYQLCINKQMNMNLSGRTDVIYLAGRQHGHNLMKQQKQQIQQDQKPYYRQFNIILRHRDLGSSQNQTENSKRSMLSLGITPTLQLTNHVINQQQRNIDKAVFDSQIRVFETSQPLLLNKSVVQYTLQIKKVVMITDYSILPNVIKSNIQFLKNEQRVQSWFYGQEFKTETYDSSTDTDYSNSNYTNLFIACFKRSMYTNTYLRHFVQLDTVLAQAFALMGLFSMISFCLYSGYNSWILQKENIGSKEKVNYHQKNNIFYYYSHQAKKLCVFISEMLIRLFTFCKCNKFLHVIKKYVCCCILQKNQVTKRREYLKRHVRLEQQLDIYRSRRDINYLRKRVQILQQCLQLLSMGQQNLQLRQIFNKKRQIQLSEFYQLTDSMISDGNGKSTDSMQSDQGNNMTEQLTQNYTRFGYNH